MKIENSSLPSPGIPVKVRRNRRRAWRDAVLWRNADNVVGWEIWHKNTVEMCGCEPGDRWMPIRGGDVHVVEKFIEKKAKHEAV